MTKEHAMYVLFVQLVLPLIALISSTSVAAQVAPSANEVAEYKGLLAAAHRNQAERASKILSGDGKCTVRDSSGRSPIHIATHASAYKTLEALVKGGCNIRDFDSQSYDAITIAAVANDVQMVRLAIKLGGDPAAVTSPYDGTALIAAAHLGHVEVVKTLIKSGAPLDHVNNLGWTALIEAVVLGDGGENHVETARALVDAGADKSIRDRNGMTPLQLAKQRRFPAMIQLLER